MNDIKHKKQVGNVRKGSDRQSDELGADQKENTIYIKHRKQIETGKVIEGRIRVKYKAQEVGREHQKASGRQSDGGDRSGGTSTATTEQVHAQKLGS